MAKLHNIIIVLALLVLLFHPTALVAVDDWSVKQSGSMDKPAISRAFPDHFFLKGLKTGKNS